MTEHASDRWLSAGLSILVHAVLVALVGYGWWSFHARSHPLPVLAIDATVVDGKALGGPPRSRPPPAPAPLAPAPRPPSAADDQTVTPPPDESQRQAQRAEERAKAQEQQQRQAEAQRKADAERAAAEQKAQQETERRAQEQAERQAREDAQRKAHEEAERKAREEAKRQAEEKRKQQEAQQLAENEADLRKGIDADEHALEARSGAAMASYVALITARIQRAWNQPPTAREGLVCTLYVTQVPGGQVVNVKLGACNGDAAVKQSIIDAAYRASPLPAPSDPSLFERQLEITFRPTD